MENREIPIDPSAFDYIQLQYDDAVNDDALDYADALPDEGEYSDPFEAVAQQELVTQLWGAIIDCAGWRDVKIFIEHEFDGKTFKAIGEEFGMSKANAGRIYHKVFEKMKGYRVLNILFEHGFEEEVCEAFSKASLGIADKFSDNVWQYYIKTRLLAPSKTKKPAETEEPTGEVIEEVAPVTDEAAALTEEPTEEVVDELPAWFWGSAPIHHFLTTDNKYTFKIIDKMRLWSALLKDSRYLNALYITYERPEREYCVEFERMSIKRDLQKVVIKGKFGYRPASIEIELYEFLDVLGLSADLLNQPEDQISSTIVDAVKRIAYSNPASTC